jgi:hypothetical protein
LREPGAEDIVYNVVGPFSFENAHAARNHLGQRVRADNYRGKRVRFTATRPLKDSSSGWRQVEIVLDVPNDAIGIAFGVNFRGAGRLFIDDLKWEIVPATGPTTDVLLGPAPPILADPVTAYAGVRLSPENMDFESR